MKFEKIKKRYALNNSYFKNCRRSDPQTPLECFYYLEEHGELPYKTDGHDNWLYECFHEYNKRNKDYKRLDQFFTPEKTADRMIQLLDEHAGENNVYALDLCCGYGALSKKNPFVMNGLEIDPELCDLYRAYTENECIRVDFNDYKPEIKWQAVISNPPFKSLNSLLSKLYKDILADDGVAVLLLPLNFVDKDRPKALVEILNLLEILHREQMKEDFSHTRTKGEIVVIKKVIRNV